MQKLIASLRSRGLEVNPPATPEQLEALEAALGYPVPAPVRELYEAFDGIVDDEQGDMWCRIHTLEDTIAALEDFRAPYEEVQSPALANVGIPLFNDGGDNYLVYCTLTECSGRIIYSEHEMTFEPQVIFADLREAFEARYELDDGDLKIPQIYPARAGDFPGDEASADACIQAWRSNPDEVGLFFLALACGVLPREREGEMLTWLNEVDRYSVRPIYDSLGRRRTAEAVPALETLMHRTKAAGDSFSSELGWIAQAIASIDTVEAKEALIRLDRTMPDNTLKQLIAQVHPDGQAT
ncbi:SMI1/KNR4 family protein [Deinococcus koreensis]|nr:SMI1/KNR4 family protein [Deinococcus koreensis]